MKNNIINTFIVVTIIFSIFIFFTNPQLVFSSVDNTIILWATKVFPVLFPFFIICNLAIELGAVAFISEYFKPINKFLFKTTKNSGFIFVLSIISGNPSGAMMISQMYKNKLITYDDSKTLIMYTAFVNPIFVLGTIGFAYFNNPSIGYIILISHILSNILIGVYLGLRKKSSRFPEVPSIKKSYAEMTHHRKKIVSIGETLTNALQRAISTMFFIGGFMIFFNLVVIMINNIFTSLNITNIYFKSIIIGLIEMVNGVDFIYNNIANPRIAVTLIAGVISFAGFSIHAQIYTFMNEIKLKYLPFLAARLIQGILASFITYFIYPILIKNTTVQTMSKINNVSPYHNNLLLISILMLILTLSLLIISNIKSTNNS